MEVLMEVNNNKSKSTKQTFYVLILTSLYLGFQSIFVYLPDVAVAVASAGYDCC